MDQIALSKLLQLLEAINFYLGAKKAIFTCVELYTIKKLLMMHHILLALCRNFFYEHLA